MTRCCTAIAVGAAIGAVAALAAGYLLLMYGGDSVLSFDLGDMLPTLAGDDTGHHRPMH